MNHFAKRVDGEATWRNRLFVCFCPVGESLVHWVVAEMNEVGLKHELSNQLSNLMFGNTTKYHTNYQTMFGIPDFGGHCFCFNGSGGFFSGFKSYETRPGVHVAPVAGILRVVSWRPKLKLKLRRWALWSAYCLKINIIFWANFWGAQNWANFWASFGRIVLDSFFFGCIFANKIHKKKSEVCFFWCDFDRRSRDEKMNAEKRRERRSAKKSSKKKNDFSSYTRSSCSFSSIFGWRCFFQGSRIGVSFLVELSRCS